MLFSFVIELLNFFSADELANGDTSAELIAASASFIFLHAKLNILN